MKSRSPDPEFSTVEGERSSLSGEALREILRETLARRCSLRLRVRGYSMFPCIMDNDVVTVSPLDGHLSYVGLAVAFIHPSRNGLLMIHRVIRQTRNAALIKGDNCSGVDGFIPYENILGVVTKIERSNRDVYFGIAYGSSLVLFFNKTNIFTMLFRIGGRLPRGLRQVIKTTLFR